MTINGRSHTLARSFREQGVVALGLQDSRGKAEVCEDTPRDLKDSQIWAMPLTPVHLDTLVLSS